ncbi:MAG: AmmeMemoRadiSam system radical SAM enzyme [Syntrophomonadaceae bacterium]|nr:AmmeMemoRadiSam system radical SAM enzyme [Syntrophomonadaceae bacterium]
MPAKEAMFYEQSAREKLKCLLCPHHCRLREGQEGLCRVRVNREGRLLTLNYAEVASLALDPIEKKPLYHFFPGSLILSAGTFGCNLACAFCQNYSLAHEKPETRVIDSAALVEIARQVAAEGSVGVAFTYNEPSIWYEYVRETAEKLKEHGLQVVLVTNGYIEARPLQEILALVDAMNIDVKAYNDDFYRQHCRGKLQPVLDTVEKAATATHVEVTTLLIPGENDAPEEISSLARWLASLNKSIPLHLSRYHPAYKFTQAATTAESLQIARELAREHLNFVYLGNIPGEENSTPCLNCGEVLVKRSVYEVEINALEDGHCRHCGDKIDYITSA